MKILSSVSVVLAFTSSCSAFPFARWFKRQTLMDMDDGEAFTVPLIEISD